jgi:deoxycytidine triphosphate deaminase
MNILKGEVIAGFVGKLITQDKQVGPYSVDLTVKSISQLDGVGRVDFSGKEFAWGQRTILSPKQVQPADELGWWRLPEGEYIVRFNEALNLPPGTMAIILPHERISQNGAYHSALLIHTPLPHAEVLLQVGKVGIEIKENARISYLLAFGL